MRPRALRYVDVAMAVVALSFSMSIPLVARAAPSAAEEAEADALFEEGRRLMDQGALDEACGKLERSFQLAPRLGTMLNLGGCSERRGQLARAIALYERAATLARELGRTDREVAAREFAAALEPRVAKLLVISDERSSALVTQVDGETISTLSGLVPLDPGKRRLTARAPGRLPFEIVLDLHPGETRTITIPRLKEEPKAAPPPNESEASASSARTVGLVAGFAASAVGIGLGTFFGLEARAKHEDSLAPAQCDASGCSPRGLQLIDDAKSAGNASTVAFVAGGVVLAATVVVLVLTRRPSSPASHAVATALVW